MVYSFEAMAYVYIMTNKRRTVLYIGSTPDIAGRTLEHKLGLYEKAFTLKYKCFLLVWYEEHEDLSTARDQEYRMKRWRRAWKEAAINALNPEWKDLSAGWYEAEDLQ